MQNQVNKNQFKDALRQLGHDPKLYEGRKLSLDKALEIYELSEEDLLKAVEKEALNAYYDMYSDNILFDALELAYFYFCVESYATLYASK